MTELKFRTEKPAAYFDRSKNMTIMLNAEFVLRADTDDGHCGSMMPLYASAALTDVLGEYERTVPYSELSGRYAEISRIVSEKLTEKINVPCTAELVSLEPDEFSAKMIKQLELAEKMKDPAFAAAELERAMQQARETAEKNGIDLSALQNMPMPDMPAASETDDTLARAQAMAAHYEQLKKAAAAPVYAAAAQQTAPRPVFCGSCGGKLPESGNFCPNCGAKI